MYGEEISEKHTGVCLFRLSRKSTSLSKLRVTVTRSGVILATIPEMRAAPLALAFVSQTPVQGTWRTRHKGKGWRANGNDGSDEGICGGSQEIG